MSYTIEDSLAWAAHCTARAKWGEDEPVNIFYLDHDPAAAAQSHVDRHVVKMILETAQLLSTAWHAVAPDQVVSDLFFADLPGQAPPGECPAYPQLRLKGGGRIYRKTHERHPCAVWARAHTGNYNWLHRLGLELCREYTFRYKRAHACEAVLATLQKAPPGMPKERLHDEPPLAMPQELKVVDADGCWDAVPSYRRYYVEAKHPLFRWTKRAAPSWVRCVDGVWGLL